MSLMAQHISSNNHHGFNWYDWGDARIEKSSLVGDRWRDALADGAAKNQSELCAALGC